MPRLPTHLLRHANVVHTLLPLLLRSCRTLPSALNELRWLREHLESSVPRSQLTQRSFHNRLHNLCRQRSRGKPLQYILGDQPFGHLSILCRKGVLIPRSSCPCPHPVSSRRYVYTNVWPIFHRPETETWATHLANQILQDESVRSYQLRHQPFRVLDLCTGTGCIPLLLYSLLHRHYPALEMVGVDISTTAIRLARRNLRYNISKNFLPASASAQIHFLQDDIFAQRSRWQEGKYDVVVSNPPYISPRDYDHRTTRSVRNHEPKLALVPKAEDGSDEVSGLALYPRVVSLANHIDANIMAVEVGNMQQARHVVEMAGKKRAWRKMQVWRDDIIDRGHSQMGADGAGNYPFTDHGTGEGRAVIAWK